MGPRSPFLQVVFLIMNFLSPIVSIVFLPAVIVRAGVGKHDLDEKMTNGERAAVFLPLALMVAYFIYASVALVQMCANAAFFDITEGLPWIVTLLATTVLLIRWWVISDESAAKLVAARKAVNETLYVGLLAVVFDFIASMMEPSAAKAGMVMAGIGFLLVIQAMVARLFLSTLELPDERAVKTVKVRKLVKPVTPLLKAKARLKAAQRRERAAERATSSMR